MSTQTLGEKNVIRHYTGLGHMALIHVTPSTSEEAFAESCERALKRFMRHFAHTCMADYIRGNGNPGRQIELIIGRAYEGNSVLGESELPKTVEALVSNKTFISPILLGCNNAELHFKRIGNCIAVETGHEKGAVVIGEFADGRHLEYITRGLRSIEFTLESGGYTWRSKLGSDTYISFKKEFEACPRRMPRVTSRALTNH